jgi:hypothetical protein
MPAKEDIPETKVNSFKRGIESNRIVNPLNPSYKYPGWSEISNSNSNNARPKTAHQRFDAFIGK